MSESLLEFPCEVTVKAMGLANAGFTERVQALVCAHLDDPGAAEVSARQSSKGKYLSVNVTFTASSQAQLESVYGDLNDCEDVVFTL